ncbi:MAG: DUF5666 domain-containing protein [Pseudomonadota bacterium]
MSIKRPILAAVTAMALSGCGGGGSSSSAAPAPGGATPPPSAPALGAQLDLVRGAITGFGSVFVGGRRYATDDAMFLVDDVLAAQSDLAVGMVIKVTGSRADGTAAVVRYDELVKGPIDAVAGDGLTVVGQTVILSADTVLDDLSLADLQVGRFVEVSGYRDEDEAIVASYLGSEDDPEVEVAGRVQDLDATSSRFRIGGLTIDYAAAALEDLGDGLANGRYVEVEDENGRYSPGDLLLIATEVDADDPYAPDSPERLRDPESDGDDDPQDADDDVDELELEGIVTRVDADEFEVGGFSFRVDDRTRFRFGDQQRLLPGARVEVEAAPDADGTLFAEEIRFEDREVEVTGPLELVEDDRLIVFGVEVRLDEAAELEDDGAPLLPGDRVEVEGVEVDGVLLAAEVEREDDDAAPELRGIVQAFDADAGTLEILGVTVRTDDLTQYEFEDDDRDDGRDDDDEEVDADTFFAGLVAGLSEVSAQWPEGTLGAQQPVAELEFED